jgi:hypothetical protein
VSEIQFLRRALKAELREPEGRRKIPMAESHPEASALFDVYPQLQSPVPRSNAHRSSTWSPSGHGPLFPASANGTVSDSPRKSAIRSEPTASHTRGGRGWF